MLGAAGVWVGELLLTENAEDASAGCLLLAVHGSWPAESTLRCLHYRQRRAGGCMVAFHGHPVFAMGAVRGRRAA